LLNARRILTCVDRFKNRPVAAARIRKHYSTELLGGARRGLDRAYVLALLGFGPLFCEPNWFAQLPSVDDGERRHSRQLRPRQAAPGTPPLGGRPVIGRQQLACRPRPTDKSQTYCMANNDDERRRPCNWSKRLL